MNKTYRRIYLKHKLKWTLQRRKSLNQIEDKLQLMKELAQYVRDNHPTPAENELIDKTFQKLKTDIETLDQESKNPGDYHNSKKLNRYPSKFNSKL